MLVCFTPRGWADYTLWEETDKKTLKKVKELIKEILRHPFEGIGKPEALKNNLSGYWSRRITDEHRIVYYLKDDLVVIVQCRHHY